MKYIICQRELEGNKHRCVGAGTKAVSDVETIACEYGYCRLYINHYKDNGTIWNHLKSQVATFLGWCKALKCIKKGDILLIQCPNHRRQLGRKIFQKKIHKKAVVVSLIHDVEELRCNNDEIPKQDLKDYKITLECSDYFIVHNNYMKSYFLSKGIEEKKLVSLEIFDYLTPQKGSQKEFAINNKIAIAGNCSKEKAPYIYLLDKLNCKFELYGTNYEGAQMDNVTYHGVVDSELLPSVIEGHYGLIWDGNKLSECTGNTGNYMRYNNPHKTSLYIVSGLPIIIWSKAAMAEFVVKNKIGIAIDNLEELNEKLHAISKSEYEEYAKNTIELADKLMSGYYTKEALKKIEDMIREKK